MYVPISVNSTIICTAQYVVSYIPIAETQWLLTHHKQASEANIPTHPALELAVADSVLLQMIQLDARSI